MDTAQDKASIDRMLDVNAVAEILGCSSRHVYRMADAGHMPRPVHIGKLVRWQQSNIKQWIDERCRKLRRVAKQRDLQTTRTHACPVCDDSPVALKV